MLFVVDFCVEFIGYINVSSVLFITVTKCQTKLVILTLFLWSAEWCGIIKTGSAQ